MHARGRLELEQKATPEMKVLADELATLRARLDKLEVSAVRSRGTPPFTSLDTAQLERLLFKSGLGSQIPRSEDENLAMARALLTPKSE
jgi:hypothetical protein